MRDVGLPQASSEVCGPLRVQRVNWELWVCSGCDSVRVMPNESTLTELAEAALRCALVRATEPNRSLEATKCAERLVELSAREPIRVQTGVHLHARGAMPSSPGYWRRLRTDLQGRSSWVVEHVKPSGCELDGLFWADGLHVSEPCTVWGAKVEMPEVPK